MSMDNQLVIAANPDSFGITRYTARIVWCPSDLLIREHAFEKACKDFLWQSLTWFEGPGALGRARQFAHLIAEDFKMNGGYFEYEDPLFIEISEEDGRVYRLSRRGRRIY